MPLSSRWRGAGVRWHGAGAKPKSTSTGEGGGVGDGDGGSRVDSGVTTGVTTVDVVEGGGQNSRRRSSDAGGGFFDKEFGSSELINVRSNCLSIDSATARKLVRRMIAPLRSALSLGRLPISS